MNKNIYSNYTVLIPTYNEQNRIQLAIRNFKNRARVVVIDNYSTDNTVAVAAGEGAEAIRHQNQGVASADDYHFMFDLVKTEWFLIAYCGHYFPLPLVEGIEHAISSGQYDAIFLDGYPIQYGKKTRVYGLNRTRRLVTSRCARKTSIDLSRYRIHHELPYKGADSRVWYPPFTDDFLIHNYRDNDITMMTRKTCIYAAEESRQALGAGKQPSLRRLIFRPIFDLAKRLIWRRGLLEGWRGIVIAVAQSYQRFCVEAYLFERKAGIHKENPIAQKNEVMRDKALSQTNR